ncbi:MAG: hypothetical protein FJZ63_06030, partial [Chlamydiae bacterium]|nr:hypothetical protein [Chlamydiota bacterium]
MYKPCNNHREEIFSKVCSKTLDFIGFKETLKRLGVFWERAPALEVALQLLIGASLAWQLSLVALGFGVFILLPSRGSSLRLMRGAGAIAVGYILMQSHLPPLLQGPLQGKAKACILEKKEGSFFGRTFLCYKLQLKQFVASGRCYKNIFCTLRVKPKEAFLADHDVEITEATLTCTSPRHYQLKLTKASQVEPIEHSFSWAEKRYRWKQGVIRHLSEYIQDKKVLKLLSALSVGYLDHKTLGYEFARLGLQHLLTISGFHFALLTFFFASFLKPFFSKKIKILIL